MKLKVSLKGKIAIAVIITYIIIALLVPIMPLRPPLSYRAPPTDIFVPQIVANYSFPYKIVRMNAYEDEFYIITESSGFIDYNILDHNITFEENLPLQNYSDIKILRIYPHGFPVFYNQNYIYVFSGTALVRYHMNDTVSIYILNPPFSSFTGFVAYNSTGLYAFQYSPYGFSPEPLWHIVAHQKPLGLHYDYNHIFVSFHDKIIDITSNGKIVWEKRGNFTSNPIFLPTYGNDKLYIASHNEIEALSIRNGSKRADIHMPCEITSLEYRGGILFAYSPSGVFGKVDVLKNGFSWKVDDVKKYVASPFIDGIGVIFKNGKIGFILTDGAIQWGKDVNVYNILLTEMSHTTYLLAILENQKDVQQYSYSGKMITPLPPSKKYILGTDFAGRDVFSQLLWSFRSELYIAFVSGAIVLLLGTLWGLIAGYFGGTTDELLLLLSDSFLFIPAIGYAALMIYLFGISHHIEATIWTSIFALSPLEARAVRNYTKVVKEKAFVESAKLSGAGHWRIILVHIFPEIKGISTVYALSAVTMALLLEVGISFLGFGNYTVPTWGWMISNAYFTGYWDKWWLIVPPLLALWAIVYSTYLLSHEIYASEYIFSLEARTIGEETKSK